MSRDRTTPYALGPIEVVPADAPLGAEVRGADLSQALGRAALDAIKQAWAAHLVLIWREQSLTVGQHVALGRQFGELEDMSHVATAPGLPRLPRFEGTPPGPPRADLGGRPTRLTQT